ncbi:unnamed protein product [Phytophthora lilii]|uniref:Unnamed protein product n=1 Tax=Phytophthora lilii TaxID=2077276 RepID=A0A9W7CI81_9STRA|nr:unnamed protein product [Phytophthora lilii]
MLLGPKRTQEGCIYATNTFARQVIDGSTAFLELRSGWGAAADMQLQRRQYLQLAIAAPTLSCELTRRKMARPPKDQVVVPTAARIEAI